MQTKTKQLSLAIATAITILMGIEAKGMESEQKNINHPFYTMMTNAPEAMLPYFSPEDRIQFFSTCHDLNSYGIENYYREQNSVLKTIGWYQLQFPSTGALVRFNMLLLKMTKLFKFFCDFNDEANPQKYEDRLAGTYAFDYQCMRSDAIPVLSEKKESIESQNKRKETLKYLSEYLIRQVDNAHSKGTLATYTGITTFEDYSPLRYLLRWVECCADDQVKIRHDKVSYSQGVSIDENHNLRLLYKTIQMTGGAVHNLDQYCKIIRRFQKNCCDSYSAEIGFHAHFFIDWMGLQNKAISSNSDITLINHHPNIDELSSKDIMSYSFSPIIFPLFCLHPKGVHDSGLFLTPFYMHPHFYTPLGEKITNDCFNQGHAYSILRLARFANKEELVKKILEHELYVKDDDRDLKYLNLPNSNGSSQQ